MNTDIEIYMKGYDSLVVAMCLAGQIFNNVKGYKVEDNTMILYWLAEDKGVRELPYPMDLKQAAHFVWGWLQSTEPDAHEPDTDGSTGKAWHFKASHFRVWKEDDYSFIKIRPVWFVYGK